MIVGSGSGSIRVTMIYDLATLDAVGSASFMLGSYSSPTFTSGVTGNGMETATVPVVFGTFIPISGQLNGFGTGDAVNFSSALFRFFQSFEVLDASGNPIQGYEYVSTSNGDYGFSGGTRVAVPEPSTSLMLTAGFGALALARRYLL